jgi:hypothetical protein
LAIASEIGVSLLWSWAGEICLSTLIAVIAQQKEAELGLERRLYNLMPFE